MKEIMDMDQWNALAGELAEAGYTVYITQYDWYEPDGFIVRFWASCRPAVYIMTRSEKVKKAIIDFNGIQRRKAVVQFTHHGKYAIII